MATLIGLHVGQRHQPSGICVVEEERRSEIHYNVRFLERIPSGTNYPQIAQRAGEVTIGAARRAGATPELYVNATGFGAPIVGEVRKATGLATVVSVYFNHGDQLVEDGNSITLGKARLVTQLQLLLQSGRLHLPQSPEAEILGKDLQDYEIQPDPAANQREGAFRVGSRDELVTALGMALSGKKRHYSAIIR